ncbi:TPA: helix-turn-helix transcriptional regulator [Streptococcus suis]|nr:helix-turn-helix transcriptional regulator [Streptococcus suis]
MKIQSLFSTRLKLLRKQKQLTQQKLADELGVSQGSYANWEKGNREPKLENLVKLAKILDSTIDFLLGVDREERS